jgi:O-antigen ligase
VSQASLEAPGQGRLRERLDTFCARAILLIVLFILVWAPLAYGGMSPTAFLVIQGATVIALALWIVRFWVQRPFRLLWPPVCWAVLAFLLYALARCRVVEVEYVGRQQLIQVLVYGSLFLVVLNNLNRKHSANFVSLTFIAVGFLLSLFAMFQLASHSPMIWDVHRMDQYMKRGSGTFINPNHLAGFLGLAVPLALGYTVMSRFSATIKVLLAYIAVTMLAGILATMSRGGILAMVLALILFCAVLLAQRDFWRSALVILGVLIVLATVALSQFDSVQKRFDEAFKNDKVGDGRQLYWTAAWQLTGHNVLWGIGPGQFDVEFPSVRPWQVQSRPTYVHNDYLNTLCEWGVVGIGIVVVACGLLYWGVYQVWLALRRPAHEMGSRLSDRSAFVVGGTVGLVCLMLHCIVEFDMRIAAVAVTAVTLMALLAAQARFATERYWINPGRLGKVLLTVLALATIGYLSEQGARKGTQTFWIAQAKMQTQPERVIALATKALAAEPMDWEADYRMGEYFWGLSLLEGPDYLDRAKQAMTWYAKAMQLNPYDGYPPVACGMCLDRIGHTWEATPYFEMAHQNDPHNTYIALEEARHSIELGDLAAAKKWFNDSFKWDGDVTPVAVAEEQKLERMMADPLWKALAIRPPPLHAGLEETNKTTGPSKSHQ